MDILFKTMESFLGIEVDEYDIKLPNKIRCQDNTHSIETTYDGKLIGVGAVRRCDICLMQLCGPCSKQGFKCIGMCERYCCQYCESKTKECFCNECN